MFSVSESQTDLISCTMPDDLPEGSFKRVSFFRTRTCLFSLSKVKNQGLLEHDICDCVEVLHPAVLDAILGNKLGLITIPSYVYVAPRKSLSARGAPHGELITADCAVYLRIT